MIPKFRCFDKKYKKIMKVNEINFEKSSVWIESDSGDHENRHTLTRVFDEVILMQSTGLHDQNGIEVFEGDLIHYTYRGFDWYVPVVYSEGRFEVYHGTLSTIPASKIPSGKYVTNIGNSIRMHRVEFTDMYVAGNIYENPELLEVV